MPDLIRDSGFGQLVRWATRGHLYQYAEERPDFQLPESYRNLALQVNTFGGLGEKEAALPLPSSSSSEAPKDEEATLNSATPSPSRSVNGVATDNEDPDRDLERAETTPDELEKVTSKPIAPTRTKDGVILVDWYSTDDPEMPQNWSSWKKTIVVLQI